MNKSKITFSLLLAGLLAAGAARAQSDTDTNLPAWLTRPLSMADALNTALRQNAAILEAQSDLEASQGIVIQTRAVALPSLKATGQYADEELTLVQPYPSFSGATNASIAQAHQNWNAGVQLVQSIYMGGRIVAAFKAAAATQKQSVAQYQTAVADALLNVRVAYYDVLLAAQQVKVHEASVTLLEKELDDQRHRFDAGTVPKFNVLQAEVAAANERPNLIQARNSYRIAKNNLTNLLGYNLPRDVWEDVPLNLIDGFDDAPYQINLPEAIQQALTRRTELEALRKDVELQNLNIVDAKAGYKPNVSLFAGYNWQNNQLSDDPGNDLDGWNAGAQLSWNIFDGALTRGKVQQAKAQLSKSETTLADEARQIELAVRTAYSDFIQARETLDSQKTVQEEAEEALREAKSRAEAGTGTQLDVLNAETSLTQARTTQIQALHDYSTARARFDRAVGADFNPAK